MILLPLTYFGNIEYYAHLLEGEECRVEACCSYEKQTYANRCTIVGANGVQNLTVPVAKPWHNVLVKDVRIAYDEDWQTMHWRALRAAYNSSPFFEFYADELSVLYTQRYEFLVDFDRKAEEIALSLLGLTHLTPRLTEDWIPDEKLGIKDYRNSLHPKKKVVPLHIILGVEYYQVFTPKFGFIPNLSIIDLLMNMGNESRIYLRKIINK